MSELREIRELQRKLLRDWLSANRTNSDIYNQIVNPMNNIDYDYFLDFLLLLHQNGAVDNELVTNYILTDAESKEQLRKLQEEKRKLQ
jgi:dephospho-CoA kinase